MHSQNSIFSTIHDIEPISNHYKDLKKLNEEKRPAYASMDKLYILQIII